MIKIKSNKNTKLFSKYFYKIFNRLDDMLKKIQKNIPYKKQQKKN